MTHRDDEILEALRRVSRAIRVLARTVDQSYKMAPAVVLVCPSLSDYHRTREMFLAARKTMASHLVEEFTDQKHGPEIECFKYEGIEFQLICHEQMMTRTGKTLGATEIGYVYMRGLPPLSDSLKD